jgi:hypothetical protein
MIDKTADSTNTLKVSYQYMKVMKYKQVFDCVDSVPECVLSGREKILLNYIIYRDAQIRRSQNKKGLFNKAVIIFERRATILEHTGISKDNYYKARRYLERLGIIQTTVKTSKDNTKQTRITLVQSSKLFGTHEEWESFVKAWQEKTGGELLCNITRAEARFTKKKAKKEVKSAGFLSKHLAVVPPLVTDVPLQMAELPNGSGRVAAYSNTDTKNTNVANNQPTEGVVSSEEVSKSIEQENTRLNRDKEQLSSPTQKDDLFALIDAIPETERSEVDKYIFERKKNQIPNFNQ